MHLRWKWIAVMQSTWRLMRTHRILHRILHHILHRGYASSLYLVISLSQYSEPIWLIPCDRFVSLTDATWVGGLNQIYVWNLTVLGIWCNGKAYMIDGLLGNTCLISDMVMTHCLMIAAVSLNCIVCLIQIFWFKSSGFSPFCSFCHDFQLNESSNQ